MDVSEQITKFQEFIQLNYYKELYENVNKGLNFLVIDFGELAKFSPELCELMLEQPEEVIKAAEISIGNFDLQKKVKGFTIRITNLSTSQKMQIRNIRSIHLGKLLMVEGTVRQKSDVRPQVTSARFECPSCGNIIPVLQLDTKFKEPSRCGCGRKGKFRLISKELVDVQGIVLEEATKDLEGGEQPKRINILLKNDLVSPITEKKTNPGSTIRVIGIVKEVPIILRSGGQSTKFDLLFEANYIEVMEEDYYSIIVSPEEEAKIKELAKSKKIYDKLAKSLAPGIFGHDKIKEALILQFLGGVSKLRDDGVRNRGDIHILLIGDPGSGKSQLLKRASVVAPKARYVSGKGVSGAGLTAAVVKDEFLSGWSLEAGALVLANKGIVMIDELDKMSNEDRSAMHEGLEQQSFHYDTLFQFSDGSEMKIGEYVEYLFKKHPEKIITGKDCQILKLDEFDKKMLTTNWSKIYQANIDRVSRHSAPKEFIEITASNGREIVVTPEHPVFCIENAKIITKNAEDITKDDWVPVPLNMPINGEEQKINVAHEEVYNARSSQHIAIPEHNDVNLFKIIGYMLSEGSKEINRGKVIGINFTNNNKELIEDFKSCMDNFFGLNPYIQQTKKPNEKWFAIRYISMELAGFLKKTAPEILEKASKKEIPQLCMKGTRENIAAMLSCMFEGDGHVSKKLRTIRAGYASTSRRMCEQVQDLLLRFGIRSNLTAHKGCYKVSITGYENLLRFNQHIGFVSERKNKITKEYLAAQDIEIIRTVKDIVPNCENEIISLLEKYKINCVGRNKLFSMKHDYIKRGLSISKKHLQKTVLLLEQYAKAEDILRINNLKTLAFGDIGFEKIRNIRRIENTGQEWAYDITVEPNHAFVSQNMVLHNTISISKANIQATLRCETTVLAAANPKFGRFDPYESISKQIDMPPALINRFDLIFTIKDLPDIEKDQKMAQFILTLHKDKGIEVTEISTPLLRKYIAYAKQNITPVLTDEALNELKEYYVKMRSSGASEEAVIKVIPISPRQLEALVRLAEASAKARLSKEVTKEDAKRAIGLLHYCLEQVGLDPETGRIDIDRITTGITTSERTKIIGVREIINELEEKLGKVIPIEEVMRLGIEKGMEERKIEEAIEKLKRTGDIFEPKPGKIQKI